MRLPVRAVLFDLDGTLVDSIELIFAAHHYTLTEHLGACPDRRTLRQKLGRSLLVSLTEYAAEYGCVDPDATGRAMVETYRAWQRVHEPEMLRPVPGMREALVELAGRRLVLGVVTSKAEYAARRSLVRYDLEPLLPVAVFHDDTERHKPDPAPLLEAARQGGFDPADAAYVGDSIHDIAAGRAAGMKTVGALWGAFGAADLLAAGADALAQAAGDLPGLFEADGTMQA
jgi:pyrophosphatase PpaX